MSKNAGQRIVDAVNEITGLSHNPGYGKEVTHVVPGEHGYTAVLGRPCVIEGEYEVLPNLVDLVDEHINRGK